MRQFAPWILVAVALAAVFPAIRIQGQAKEGTAEKNQAGGKTAEKEDSKEDDYPQKPENPCRPKKGDEEYPWCEPLRVLRNFYGLVTPKEETSPENGFNQIAKEARASGYGLRFMVVLVPDPIESQVPYLFDSALDAIQKGFAEENYLFDRYWLPWMGDAGEKDHLYRKAPGILLFRQTQNPGLTAVLLVGESPKAGIHRQAFRQAMEITFRLSDTLPSTQIDILGPSFSGSVDSLMMALEDWRGVRRGVSFRIASGSATAEGIKTRFMRLEQDWKGEGFDGKLDFCRTVVPDHLLQKEASRFLRDEMKWDLRHTALLAESDTAYGQVNSEFSGKMVNVRFSSGISELRNAWKRREKDHQSRERDIKVGETQLTTSREALDLSLEDRDKALDTVPRFSPLSILARDQELAVLLETISRDSIEYVGVLATDLKDRLFVMEKVKRFAPDTVLFTFDNDILLSHVDYSRVMDGAVVISGSPLFTEGASWLPRSYWGEGRERRQFQSESHQGYFEAVRYLLDAKFRSIPQVWISAVGNGSLWPMAQLPLDGPDETTVFCQANQLRPFKVAPRLSEGDGGLAGKANLQIIFFAAALCLVSFGVRRAGFLGDSVLATTRRQEVSQILLTAGEVILALSAAILLVVAAIPEWASILSTDWEFLFEWRLRRFLLLTALTIVYVYLCCRIARRATPGKSLWVNRLLCALVIAFVPIFLVFLLFDLWMPNGEVAFFQLRARAYSSGLSPIVSLTLLAGATLVWIASELRRRWLLERQNVSDRALRAFCSCEPSLRGCQRRLKRIQGLIGRIFPQKEAPGEHPWLLPLCVLLPPVILLWDTLRPITETRGYGRLFLVLLATAAYLAALSFYRFVRIWWNLHRILMRLDHISPGLAKTFGSLASEVNWKPMRSFGFRIPPFKTLVMSSNKLKALLKIKPLAGVKSEQLDNLLQEVFNTEGKGKWSQELKARQDLEKILGAACKTLMRHPDSLWFPAVQEFLAVRIVAYLRYVFAHLRNCLMGSLGTGLLLLLAVSAYAFEPKNFVSLVIWVSLSAATIWTLWIFVQMDRNSTLSRIGGSTEGQVTLDRAFIGNLLIYGAVPLLGVIATQFPEVGRALGQIIDPLLRVIGGG